VDIFACSLDQVGLHEMKCVSNSTGGYIIMSDSFSMSVFKDSFRKMFDCDEYGYLKQGFCAKTEVVTSRDVKVTGTVAAAASLNKKSPAVADTDTGNGATCQWSMGSLDKHTSCCFFLEVQGTNAQNFPDNKQSFVQFQTQYLHASGRKRLRVTTITNRYTDANGYDIASGFDAEAAVAIVAKYVMTLAEQGLSDGPKETLQKCDKMLIRMAGRFADYRVDDPQSFNLPPEMQNFPQFMFHLRRSSFLQTFGMSPDEAAYYRAVMMREGTMNAMCMIQPALLQYSFDQQPMPVLLDSSSLRPDVILLMDDFFHVVVWRGEKIQAWFDAGYQDKEEYANFKVLLQAPATDATAIMGDRFPVPKFVQTNAGGSQARFITSKVNPSTANDDASFGAGGGQQQVLTDDVSLKVFMSHLIKLVVAEPKENR